MRKYSGSSVYLRMNGEKKWYSAFDIVGIIPLQFGDKASLEMEVYKPAGCL